MAFTRAFTAVFASLALFTIAFADESDVLKLTKDNFADVIAKEKLVFIKFFAPWCGHCQSMADAFKKTATAVKGKAVLADVDATVEQELAKKYNIDGFPTLKLFSNGEELIDYNGGRDLESMTRFIERAMLPPFDDLSDADAYEKFASDNKANNLLVGIDLSEIDSAKFVKATFALRDVLPDSLAFGVASKAEHASIDGAAPGDVYLMRLEADGSRRALKYDAESGDTIDKFVKTAALPIWQEFTQENAELYTELTIPLIVGFYTDCEGTECKALEAIARKKADNGKVAMAWVNSETLSSFKEYVGIADGATPICAYAFDSDAKYMLPEDFKFSETALEAWVDDMIAGKIVAARKSEPIPEENEGPVYTVVGDSWADIVEDPEKDVLIAQVAEWCGHCHKLKPIYAKVAEELKKAGVDHIKLALMEATENDAPDAYKAKGFPTIHFFPAGKVQQGIDFDGDRTTKAIIEWLQAKTTKKFEFDTSNLGPDPEPEEEDDEDYEDDEEDLEGEDEEDEAYGEDEGEEKEEL